MRVRNTLPWRNNTEAIAVRMAEELSGRLIGWESATAVDFRVEDCGGQGGGKAFKLSNATDPNAPSLALHILDDAVSSNAPDSIFFDRQRSGQMLLSEAGLCPTRVYDDPGKKWFVEEWTGKVISSDDLSLEVIEEVAQLIAKTHALDTGWYEEIRLRQCIRILPFLRPLSVVTSGFSSHSHNILQIM